MPNVAADESWVTEMECIKGHFGGSTVRMLIAQSQTKQVLKNHRSHELHRRAMICHFHEHFVGDWYHFFSVDSWTGDEVELKDARPFPRLLTRIDSRCHLRVRLEVRSQPAMFEHLGDDIQF